MQKDLLIILKSDDYEKINGTHLQGFVTIGFQELIKLFGDPQLDGDKSQVEWWIEKDGVVATIYDHSMPEGVFTQDVRHITNWHVGGFDSKALNLVNSLIKTS